MKYLVWTKEEFGDQWKRAECEDIETARGEIDKAVRAGGDPILTVEVPYALSIKVSEVDSETKKSEAKPDKGARGKGNGKVRRADETAPEELDKGSGGGGAGPGPGD